MSRKSNKAKVAERINANAWAFLNSLDDLPGEQFGSQGNRYNFIDNGADILLIAHTDSVTYGNFIAADEKTVRSPVLDNRIGVWLALVELPLRGVKCDVLLTEGEEMCNSTAQFFKTEKTYNWIFSFDRMGFDCALYQYLGDDTRNAVKAAGYTPVHGSYSDIVELDHLGCKGFNFGIGYRNYHSKDAHIVTAELVALIRMFLRFYDTNKSVRFAHEASKHGFGRNRYTYGSLWSGKSYSYSYSDEYRYAGKGWSVSYDVGGKKGKKGKVAITSKGTGVLRDDATWWGDDDEFVGGDAIKCDLCEDLCHPHEISLDLDSDLLICDSCYVHLNGYTLPRFDGYPKTHTTRGKGDDSGIGQCVDCGAVSIDVKVRETRLGKEQLCVECFENMVTQGFAIG